MTDDMIERMCRILAEHDGHDPDKVYANDPPMWRFYDVPVRAVLSGISDNGYVVVQRSLLDRVIAAQARFEADVPNHEPDPVTTAIRGMKDALTKGGWL